jgi:hypothetical protein
MAFVWGALMVLWRCTDDDALMTMVMLMLMLMAR